MGGVFEKLEEIRAYLSGKKTYLIASVLILQAATRWVGGEIETSEFVMWLAGGGFAGSFRAAMNKGAK